jgi:hypothetical protein
MRETEGSRGVERESELYLNKNVKRNAHLNEIVEEEKCFQLEWLFICHVIFNKPQRYEIEHEKADRFHGRVHEKPAGNSGI